MRNSSSGRVSRTRNNKIKSKEKGKPILKQKETTRQNKMWRDWRRERFQVRLQQKYSLDYPAKVYMIHDENI